MSGHGLWLLHWKDWGLLSFPQPPNGKSGREKASGQVPVQSKARVPSRPATQSPEMSIVSPSLTRSMQQANRRTRTCGTKTLLHTKGRQDITDRSKAEPNSTPAMLHSNALGGAPPSPEQDRCPWGRSQNVFKGYELIQKQMFFERFDIRNERNSEGEVEKVKEREGEGKDKLGRQKKK